MCLTAQTNEVDLISQNEKTGSVVLLRCDVMADIRMPSAPTPSADALVATWIGRHGL